MHYGQPPAALYAQPPAAPAYYGQPAAAPATPPLRRVCYFFQAGDCKKGQRCDFDHVHATTPPRRAGAKRQPEACRAFQHGTCTRGSGCWYSHADGQRTSRPPASRSERDSPYSRPSCFDFQKGKCNREHCKFSHDVGADSNRRPAPPSPNVNATADADPELKGIRTKTSQLDARISRVDKALAAIAASKEEKAKTKAAAKERQEAEARMCLYAQQACERAFQQASAGTSNEQAASGVARRS